MERGLSAYQLLYTERNEETFVELIGFPKIGPKFNGHTQIWIRTFLLFVGEAYSAFPQGKKQVL
jgi:hypothetical protein